MQSLPSPLQVLRGRTSIFESAPSLIITENYTSDMELWVDAKVILCILFVTCFCTGTDAEMPADCCLEVRNKKVDKGAFVDYQRQTSGHGCAINAMVLVTRQQRTLCVPHNETWVENIVSHVDNLKKFCKKRNYKPRACRGVKQV